ncbi:hypothetical protein MauCBS54593_000563 [Microsporum audouinii]
MNPYRYDRPSRAREHENMNMVPFPPFPLDQVEELEKNTFTQPPMRLQGPPPQYHGTQGRLAGYQGEAAKYGSASREKMDSDLVTHTHHHSYMENSLRPQPVPCDAASHLTLTSPANNSYIQSAGQADSFATGSASSLGLSRAQERNRPFYRSVPPFEHAQGPEASISTQEQSRHVSHELQDTRHLLSSRPGSFATLATFTTKGNIATSQGMDSSDENPKNLDMYYHSYGAPSARSNPKMAGSINPVLALPLQNVAGIEAGGNHGHAGELVSQYRHHHHSPQRTHNPGQHVFSVDPGTPHYPAPTFAPPIPRPVPHMNYAKHVKHATISAPATSSPTPAPKTRPPSPIGPFIPGPDSTSPTKQEEKFNIQKMMFERLGEKSPNESLDIDFSKLSVSQADHYLSLIGAPPRPKPEAENVENVTGQPNRTNVNQDGGVTRAKVTQGLTLRKAMTETLGSAEPQPPRRALSALPAHNYTNATAKAAIPETGSHKTPGSGAVVVSRAHRPEREDAMARVGASPLMTAPSGMPPSDYTKRDTANDFDSPAWDVSNLRKAGLISPPAPAPNETKNSTPQPLETHQGTPPTNYTGTQFGRNIGSGMNIKPDLANRPVPWSMDTPEDTDKKTKKAEGLAEAEKHSSGEPRPPTLEGNPIGAKSRNMMLAAEKNARIGETLKWYRADHRWNEGLRERLDVTMKENKQSHDNAKATTTESKEIYNAAEQNTALLAQAIVNLQSYLEGNPKNQLGNFAPYGPVPDECCEPSKDGNFSLFDVQPGPFKGPETRN